MVSALKNGVLVVLLFCMVLPSYGFLPFSNLHYDSRVFRYSLNEKKKFTQIRPIFKTPIFLHHFCFTPKFLHFYTNFFILPKVLLCLHQFSTPKFFLCLHQNFDIFTPIFYYTKRFAFYINFFHTKRFFYTKVFDFYTNFLLYQKLCFFYTKIFDFLHQFFITPRILLFYTKF